MSSKSPSSVQLLDLDDLDQVVGGGAAAKLQPHDPSQDTAFLASLHGVAAVVGTDAAAVASHQETSQTAVAHVEAAAQAQHISTDAALADLLGATHGDQTVATELTTRLVSGSAATELVHLAVTGSLQVADVNTIVNVATGTLAAYSTNGHSALGLSQNAAIDVIDAKIDTAAHTLLAADQAKLGVNFFGAISAVAADESFVSAFESQNSAQLASEKSIETFEGGSAAFQAGLNAAIANPLGAQNATVFGETATIVDALGSHATTALVNQIVGASGTLNAAGLASLEGAAQSAHVSTDLVLAITENLAQTAGVQQTLATELTSRFTSGAAETELVHLAATGALQVSDVSNIVGTITAALASGSADGQTVLGVTQNAAIDIIDAKIDSAAQSLLAADQHTLGATSPFTQSGYGGTTISANPAYATAQATVAADKSFVSAFEASQGAQIAVGTGLTAALGGTAIDQSLVSLDQKLGGNADVEAVMASRLASGAAAAAEAQLMQSGGLSAQTAMATLESEAAKSPTAPISALAGLEAALGGNASVEAEMARIVTSGGASTTAADQAIEATAKAGTVDATLAALDKALGGNSTVEAEMASRLASGATATDLAAGLNAGTINAASAISTIEAEARTAHVSVDASLTLLDKAAGGNSTVEAEMATRLTSGAAASDQASAIAAGTETVSQAISTLEGEATQAHLDPLSALAGLERATGGNSAVEAEMANVIRSGAASAADVGAAIGAIEAVAKPGTVDATLTTLDQKAGGNAAVEAEMATRLTNGAGASDLAAGIKAGTLSVGTAVNTLQNEAAQAQKVSGQHVAQDAALAAFDALDIALAGNTTIEGAMAKAIVTAADATSAFQTVEAANKVGTVDAALTNLDKSTGGGNATIEAEMTARIASGAAAADQAAGIKAGLVSVSAAIKTLEAEGQQSQAFAHQKLSQDPSLTAVAGLERALGGNSTVETEMANLIRQGANAAPAIAAIEASVKAGTVDAALSTLDKAAGGNAAVEAEMTSRITSGAAAADLAAGVKANTISAAQAAATLQQEAGQAHATTTDVALAALDTALGGNANVEAVMASRVAGGQALHDLTAAVTAGTITASAAITALEAESKAAHQSVDTALLALDTALGGNVVVETEMAARLASGATGSDLAAATQAGTISASAAIATIESIAKTAHTAPDMALIALDKALGGNAAVETEITARIASGAAVAGLAAAMASGLAAATVIATIEAEAKTAGVSLDTTLLSLDTAVGGNTAVETEMASRIASGATAADLAAAIKAGAITASAAVTTIEAIAKAAHASTDATLLALDKNLGGNATVEAEMTARTVSGAAASDIAAALKAGAISGATALATIEAEARAAHVSVDAALVALDTAAGGNTAVEVEMATRLANGSTAGDLGAAIAAGTLSAAAAIATIEAMAHKSNASVDVALMALDKAAGGNTAVEAEMAARLQNGSAAADLAAAMASGLSTTTAIATIEAEASSAHVSIDAALVALDKAAGGNAAVETEMATRLANGMTAHDLAAAIAAGTITGASAVSTIEAVAQKGATSIDLALIALDQAAGHNSTVEQEIAARLSSGATTTNLAACVESGTLPAATAIAVVSQALALDPAYAAGNAPQAILNLVTALNTAATVLNPNNPANTMLQAAVAAATAMLPTLYKPASNTDPIKYPGNSNAVFSAYYILFGGSPAAVLALTQSNYQGAPISGIEALASANHASIDAALLSYNSTWAPWNSTAGIAITTELANRISNGGMVADLAANITLGTVSAQSAISTIESAAARINQTAAAEFGHGFPANAINSADVTLAALDKALGGNPVIEAEMAARVASGAAFSSLAASLAAGQISGSVAVATIEAAARAAHVPPDLALSTVDQAVGGNPAIEAEMNARYSSGTTLSDTAALVASGAMTTAAAVTLLEQVATAVHAPRIASLTALDKALGGDATVEAELGKLLGNGQAEIDVAAAIAAGTMTQANGAAAITTAAGAAHTDPSAATTLLFAAQHTSDPNAGHVCQLLLAAVSGSATNVTEAGVEMGIPYQAGSSTVPAVLALAQAVHSGMPLASAENLLTALGNAAGVSSTAMITLLPVLADALAQNAPWPNGDATFLDGYSFGGRNLYANVADGIIAYFAEAGSSLATSTLASHLSSGQTASDLATRVVAGTLSQAQATTLMTSYATIAKVDPGQSLQGLTNAVNALTLTNDIASAATAINAATSNATAQAQVTAIEADAVSKGATVDSALVQLYDLTHGNAAVVQEIGSRVGEMTQAEGAQVASGAVTAQAAIQAVQTFATEGSHSVADALTQLNAAAPGNATIAAAASAAVVQEASLAASTATANTVAAINAASVAIQTDPTTATAQIAALEKVAGSQTDIALLQLYNQSGQNAAVSAEINNRLSTFINAEGALVANGTIGAEAAMAAVQTYAAAGHHAYDDALGQLSAAVGNNAAITAAHVTATLNAAIASINQDPTTAAAQIAALEQVAGGATDADLMTLYNQTGQNATVSTEIGNRIGEYVVAQGALVASGAVTGQAAATAVQAFAAAGNQSVDTALHQLATASNEDAAVVAAAANADTALAQAQAAFQAQQIQRAESFGTILDMTNQIAQGTLTQAQAIAILVAEDAHGAGLTAAQYAARFNEVQAVQALANSGDDDNVSQTAQWMLALIANPNATDSGNPLSSQLNADFSTDWVQQLGSHSLSDAVTLLHLEAEVLGRSPADLATHVATLALNIGASPDSALMQLAGMTANDPSVISAIADRLISGQAETDTANLVASGTLSVSDALTLLKNEIGVVQTAGIASNAAVLSGAMETDVVAARFQTAAVAANATAAAVAALEIQGYPSIAAFLAANPSDTQFVNPALHTAALLTAIAADPVFGSAAAQATGQATIALIDNMGTAAAAAAIQDGNALAQSGLGTAASQTLVADIEAKATAAGVSVDEALVLATMTAGGSNATLTGTIASRLIDGDAEAGIAQAAVASQFSGELGNTILTDAVQGVAVVNAGGNALGLQGTAGMNAQTVTQLVEAKYDLAVGILASYGNADAAPVQTALEANHAADITAGLQTYLQISAQGGGGNTAAAGGADSAASLAAAGTIESSLLAAQYTTALENGTPIATVLTQIAGEAQSAHLSQDQLLLALHKDLSDIVATANAALAAAGGGLASAIAWNAAGGTIAQPDDNAVQTAIASRVSSGTAASDLYVAAQAGTITMADAAQTFASAITVAQSVNPTVNYDVNLMNFTMNNPSSPVDAIIIPALSDRLIMGQAESALVTQAITGTVTNASIANAMTQIQTLMNFVEGHAGDPNVAVLPGQFEAEVVLGRMVNAANGAASGMSLLESVDLINQKLSMSLTGNWATTDSLEAAALLAQTITDTYGMAAANGQGIIPFIDAIGAPMSATALTAGQNLVAGAAGSTQDQNAQAVILGNLQNAAVLSNSSIDAAFTLADYASGGGSALLNYAMTQRLANGAAEANVAQLVIDGHMDVTTGLNVLLGEVNAVASSNANKSVLGFDPTTASELVIAKLDLAAAKLDPGGALQTTLETNCAKAIAAGLGAYAGLSGDGSTDTSMFGGAANKSDLALAGTVLQTVLGTLMAGDFADGQAAANALLNNGATVDGALDVAGQDAVSNFTSTYNNATQLAAFEKKWSVDNAASTNASNAIDSKIGAQLQTSLTINTDPTSSVGTSNSVAAFTSGDFGNGITAVAEVEAGYDTGAQVSNTGVAAHANVGAAATETFNFGHNVSLTLLTEAIASGSVSVGVNGVAVSATVGVMTTATIDQNSSFDAGNGFSGVQDTQLQAELVASAGGGASLTLSNIGAHFGAMAGDYFSATETASFSTGGFTVGASGGVMSPGVAGLSIQASASVDNNNISFSLGGTVGLELFGLSGAVNFTLPTGAVINEIEALGNDIGNAFKDAGGDIANFGQSSWNSVENAGSDALNWVEGLF